jgi:hypothetical protein
MKKQTITSFEEACEARGYDPALVLPDVTKMPLHLQAYTLASIKRVIIAEAINVGREPNWSDTNEYKWFPYWDMDDKDAPSGFGFSVTDSDGWTSLTLVGSRLVFFNREDAKYFGENFMDLHKDFLLIPKAV